jgi:hypothetical protein
VLKEFLPGILPKCPYIFAVLPTPNIGFEPLTQRDLPQVRPLQQKLSRGATPFVLRESPGFAWTGRYEKGHAQVSKDVSFLATFLNSHHEKWRRSGEGAVPT